ncbi:BTAD domain-containing putative transcriptional regulator [Streptomyces flaveolus]|uniref:AfsR/SARP family transcriptional regulator n=1 Tax=Streptomyces flaveolus TaxID=67297 RepID=UPI00342BD67F
MPGIEVLRFEVLGPLRVLRAESELDLGYPQARALLGVLLVRPGRPVRMSTIVDVLWPGRPPASAPNAVRRHVGALRKLLEPGLPPRAPGRRLLGRNGGYLLEASADEADLLRFRALSRRGMRAAATARPEQAVRHFAGALRLWRGPVAAGLQGPVRAHPHFAAVDREVLRTARMAVDAALLCGRADQVLPSVRRAAALNPLDEPLLARLILSLAACGLQAEALATYEDARRDLAAQSGVAPGAELAAAHARVLRQQIRPARHRLPTGPPDPARPFVRPAQLPPDLAVFTGRERELAALDAGCCGKPVGAAPDTSACGEPFWADGDALTGGEPLRAEPGAPTVADPEPAAPNTWTGVEPMRLAPGAFTSADAVPTAVDTWADGEPARLGPDALADAQTVPTAVDTWSGGEPLRAALTPLADAYPASAVLISGPAGIGKTALAIHWAHRIADRFPDGQLHLELGGSAPHRTALEPAEALSRLLAALGVPARSMPVGVAALAAQYRDVLAGRRLLVLLDDAACLGQLRPLLPRVPGCLTVVTSRGGLVGPTAVTGSAGATGIGGPTEPARGTGSTALAGPATATGPLGPTESAGATAATQPAKLNKSVGRVETAAPSGPTGPPGPLRLTETQARATAGVRVLELGLPSEADARDLLARRIGTARLTAEPEAVTEIIRRCGRLPSALALVAARAASRRDFALAALAADLAADAEP